MTEVISIDTPNYGICNSLWGRNECPNKAEYILVNKKNSGFAIMCEAHKDGFLRIVKPDQVELKLYSPELVKELTERAREAGLK